MDPYLILIFILFALAISDLIVGVSNDAVNFLNSALGSKAAPYNVIMVIASLGILAGAIFSNGMMEVARKGIFHPQHFIFAEIMVIFLAVMLTDVLLLDFFNTIGLPTSTTVSIVFELLGAAVAVSLIKIKQGNNIVSIDGVEKTLSLGDFINSGGVLPIIGGILLSVVIAFVVGLVVMWISRFIFTFNYKNTMKYFGAIWGGIAIASIFYFILIKGVKSASFMNPETKTFIKEQWFIISLIIFGSATILLQFLRWLFKINILKLIVLVGTFALAMAFAGNDLVNFIGVPLAGFGAFVASDGDANMLMTQLSGKVQTPAYFLIIAGLIMAVTLWFSKKARSVSETELKLSRQNEGDERFGSSGFARMIVRRVVYTGGFFNTIIPKPTIIKLRKRFDRTRLDKQLRKEKNPPMFDLIRASVNLTVASILISLATSLKLPLSTTYVTFMVAMGTSLADGAWGRDSAVFRITGVFAVIGGWFMTAITAFLVSFIIALFIAWAKFIGVFILLVLAVAAIIRSNISHKRKTKEKIIENENSNFANNLDIISNAETVANEASEEIKETLVDTIKIYHSTIESMISEDRKNLKKQYRIAIKLNEKTRQQRNNIYKIISKLEEDSVETGHYFVQVVDYQREIARSLEGVVRPIYEYIENNHKVFMKIQFDELLELSEEIGNFVGFASLIIKEGNFEEQIDNLQKRQDEINDIIANFRKLQLKRIKKNLIGTKNSLLYLTILNESKGILLYTQNAIRAQYDFVKYATRKKQKSSE